MYIDLSVSLWWYIGSIREPPCALNTFAFWQQQNLGQRFRHKMFKPTDSGFSFWWFDNSASHYLPWRIGRHSWSHRNVSTIAISQLYYTIPVSKNKQLIFMYYTISVHVKQTLDLSKCITHTWKQTRRNLIIYKAMKYRKILIKYNVYLKRIYFICKNKKNVAFHMKI